MLRAAALALMIPLSSAPAFAEMDFETHETDAGTLTEDERAALRAQIAADIAAERLRAEAARQAAQAEAERIAAQRAARPLGERLVEARCMQCHDVGQFAATRLGTPGWTWVVLRMEWLNGARLQPGERGVIVAHLASRTPDRSRAEWAGIIAVSAVLFLGMALALVRRRRRAGRERAGG